MKRLLLKHTSGCADDTYTDGAFITTIAAILFSVDSYAGAVENMPVLARGVLWIAGLTTIVASFKRAARGADSRCWLVQERLA